MPRKKTYDRYNPLFVYTEQYIQTTLEEAIRQNQEHIRQLDERRLFTGCRYKTKTSKAGRMLEVEIYPSFPNRTDYSRALREQRTGAAQKRQNDKNAQRKLVRLTHNNFGVGDIFFTGGWSAEREPPTLEACKEEMVNFIGRVRYHAMQAGEEDVRYLYVIEGGPQPDGKVRRFHVHILFSRSAGANTARRCSKCGKVYSHLPGDACTAPSILARATKAALLELARRTECGDSARR